VQIAWLIIPARPQHETNSSSTDRNSDQQYHRICCAYQMRELAMQVQACTGQTPASVRLPKSDLEACLWLSPFRPRQSLKGIFHILIRRGVLRRIVLKFSYPEIDCLGDVSRSSSWPKSGLQDPDNKVRPSLMLGHTIRACQCDRRAKEEGSSALPSKGARHTSQQSRQV
jgi:hypothetical protein